MDSVYKLTKYSQKITDACQKKQYEKVGLYNKHENLYIKKLNEYFCNQKGGANMDDVTALFEAMARAVDGMNADKETQAQEIAHLKSKALQLESNLEAKDVDIRDLTTKKLMSEQTNREEIERLNTTHARVLSEIGSKDQTGQAVTALQLQLETSNAKIAELKENLTASIAEAGKLQIENNGQRDLLFESEDRGRIQLDRIQELESQLSVSKLENETAAQTAEKVNRLLINSNTKIQDLENQLTASNLKNETDVQAVIAQTAAKIDKLIISNNVAIEAAAGLQVTVDENAAVATAQIEELTRKNSELTSKHDALLAETVGKVEQLTQELEQAKKQVSSFASIDGGARRRH